MLSRKLCLLAGVACTTVEVWMLEDYQAQDWPLKQRIHGVHPMVNSIHPMALVGLIGDVSDDHRDKVEKIIFYGWIENAYHVRSGSWFKSVVGKYSKQIGMHNENLMTHEMVFGAAPLAQGISFSNCHDSWQ